jgi:prepilin-type N-terminal cleavage/methylation domain-containing protein
MTNRASGFSLKELLVVIAIIAVLIGLLLPNVRRVRESKTRVDALNHLREIALGIHKYCEVHGGRLPPLADVGTNSPTGAGRHSFFFCLLPYVGAEQVYRSPLAESHVVVAFLNPADKSADSDISVLASVSLPWEPPAPFQKNFTRTYATTSFAANALVFGSNEGTMEQSFPDGRSNTIVIGERFRNCAGVHNLWGYAMWGPSMPAFAALTPDSPAGMPSTGMMAPALPLPSDHVFGTVQVKIGFESAPVEQPTGPSSTIAYRIFQPSPRGAIICDPRVAQTPFQSGMLVALADGSVRSISPTISEWTYWAACTPNGGETLYSDWMQ